MINQINNMYSFEKKIKSNYIVFKNHRMLSKILYNYFVFLLMIFFIYLIIYQIFDTWYKEEKERYIGVGSFGNINTKSNSFFPFNCGIFSNLSSYKSTFQEGYENEKSNDCNSPSTTCRLDDLTLKVKDISNNLYLLSDQVNQMSQQQAILAQKSLPSEPIKITGDDL